MVRDGWSLPHGGLLSVSAARAGYLSFNNQRTGSTLQQDMYLQRSLCLPACVPAALEGIRPSTSIRQSITLYDGTSGDSPYCMGQREGSPLILIVDNLLATLCFWTLRRRTTPTRVRERCQRR